jgi:hypothetical protein
MSRSQFLRLSVAGTLLAIFHGDTLSARPARAICPSSYAADYYFPAGAFDDGSKRANWDPDAFRRDWYSKHMRAATGLSLSCGDPKAIETYRFVWLRTFHHPIIVEISKLGSSVQVSSVELNGAGGYDPGAVAQRKSFNGSTTDWDALTRALAVAVFWRAATEDQSTAGFDGAQWIVEGRNQNQYQVVDRWTPTEGRFRDLGRLFLAIAKINIPADQLY